MTGIKRKPGRPPSPGITQITPDQISDWQKRPFFELAIPFDLPSTNEFLRVSRRELYRLHSRAHTCIYEGFRAIQIPMTTETRRRAQGKRTSFQVTWRLPKTMVFPGRAILHPTVYRTDYCETDPANYVTTLDKLVLDKLVEAKPGKWRAFGLLVDDSARWLYLLPANIEYGARQACVVLHFYAHVLPDFLQKR